MMIVNKYTKSLVQGIIIVGLLWLLWTLGEQWLRPFVIKQLGGYTSKEYKETVDTLEIRRDSIMWKYANLETKVENLSEPVVQYKYVYTKPLSSTLTKGKQIPTAQEAITVDKVYTYSQSITDTLIDGNIKTVINLADCKIIEQSLNYKPKFPIIVKEYITIEKTKETTLSNKRTLLGVGIVGNSKAGIGILGVYQTKNLWQIQAGYHLTSKRLLIEDTNKKEVSLAIIKLF